MQSAIKSSPALQLAGAIRRKFVEDRVLQTAGSLTFTTLLSLVPMVAVVLAVMRQFTPVAKLGEGMRQFLLQNLLPDKAGKVIATYAVQFSEKASGLTIVGTLSLVVTAVMLFQTIDHAFSSVWGVRRPRAWYVRIPVYWMALTVGPILFAGSVAASGELLRASLGLVNEPRWIRIVLDRVVTAVLLSGLFAFMFHSIPNRSLEWRHSLVGGMVAGFGVVLVQRLFGLYLGMLPSFTLIYGTFSVLPIFLIWVYVSWLIILLGATIAALLPDFSARHRLLPRSAAGRLAASLRLLMALGDVQQQGRPASLDSLALASGQTLQDADQMLGEWRRYGWVVRTEEGAWVMCVSAQSMTLGELVSHHLIGPELGEENVLHDHPEDQRRLQQVLAVLRERLRQPLGDNAPCPVR